MSALYALSYIGATTFFVKGSNGGLFPPVDSADELASHADAKQNYNTVLRWGIENSLGRPTEITWRGKTLTVERWVLEHIIPNAIEGLSLLGISRGFSERLLGLLVRQVKERKTGSYWGLRELDRVMKQQHLPEGEAIPKVLVTLAQHQQDQSTSLDDIRGVADFE